MRRSLIYSAVSFVIILVATIIIILYGNGYTYNIQSQKIQKTGVIKITSTPSGAAVYIDNAFKGNTPLSLFNLEPKEYTVSIKKDTYLPWSTKISVKGGDLSSLYPILYPSTLKPVRIESNTSVLTSYFTPSQYAYTALNKDNQLILYMHFFGSTFLNIGETTQASVNLSTLPINAAYSLDSLSTSPGGTRLLLTFTGPNLPKKYFFSNTNGVSQPIDLDTQIDTEQFSTITWGKDDAHLFLQNPSMLISLDITSGQKILLYQGKKDTTLTDVALTNNLVYYIISANQPEQNYSLFTEQFDGTNTTIIATQKTPINNLISSGDTYAYATGDNSIVIHNPTTSLNPIVITGTNPIIPVSFSPDDNILLYKDTTSALYTYSIDTKDIHPLGVSLSSMIKVTWSNSARILLYTTTDTEDPSKQYYTLNGINFDGSNNDVIFKGPMTNANFMVSPKTGQIIFEMNNLSTPPANTEKGLYQIAIPGI